MSVTMVRQKVKDGSLDEAEAAVRDLFATLDRVRPEEATTGWRFVVEELEAAGVEAHLVVPRPTGPMPAS